MSVPWLQPTDLDSLRLSSSCPLCGQRYQGESTRVLDEAEEGFLLHVQCRQCSGSVIAMVVQGKLGPNAIGILTDMTAEDLEQSRHQAPLSADDILDLHTLVSASDFRFL